MRRVLTIVGLVLVLIAGAAAVIYFVAGPQLLGLGPAGKEAAAQEKTPDAVPGYYQVKGMLLPALWNGRFNNYLAFNLTFVTRDPPGALALQDQETRLRDALLREFSKRPVETFRGPADFNTGDVKARMQEQVDRTLGPGVVLDILIGQVTPIGR